MASDSLVCASCGADRRDGSWCPMCLERYERPADVPLEPLEPRHIPALRSYSRTKAGPTSFGLVGRLSLSIIPVIVALFALRNVVRSRTDPTFAYYLVLGVPTVAIAVGFLAFVWRWERVS